MSDFNISKEEYASLRKEIELALGEFRQLERYGVFALAVAYGWLGTHPSELARVSWFVPLLLPICGWPGMPKGRAVMQVWLEPALG